MKQKRFLALFLMFILSVTLFAACAGNSGGGQSTPSGSVPAQSPGSGAGNDQPAPEPEPESALDRIRANGKLVMLTNAAFPPFEYLGADNRIAGVDADVAARVAEEIGVDREIIDMDFAGIPMAISSGQGDLGVAGMTATVDRRQVVDFSINYVETTQLIIVQEGNEDIGTPDDLKGKIIGVQLGTTGDLFASDVEGAEIIRFKTGPDAGLALANGQVECVVIDAMPAQMIVDANTGLRLLEEPFTEEEYAIAIAKGNDVLKAVVDRVLAEMLADGSINALIEQHMEALA